MNPAPTSLAGLIASALEKLQVIGMAAPGDMVDTATLAGQAGQALIRAQELLQVDPPVMATALKVSNVSIQMLNQTSYSQVTFVRNPMKAGSALTQFQAAVIAATDPGAEFAACGGRTSLDLL